MTAIKPSVLKGLRGDVPTSFSYAESDDCIRTVVGGE